MNRSFLLTFVAVLLLADSAAAYVAMMWSGTSAPIVYGCVEPNNDCTSANLRNSCCTGAACECDAEDKNCVCKPNKNAPSSCAARNDVCDIRFGCCNANDACDCSLGASCRCKIDSCLKKDADCSIRKRSCCGSLICNCPNASECHCSPPPPPPCRKRTQSCNIYKDNCCPGEYCYYDSDSLRNQCRKDFWYNTGR